MSDKILDADGNPLIYWPLGAIKAGTDSAQLPIQVKCGPGEILSCESSPDGTVYASHDGGIFVNLQTSPIDLTPFGVTYKTFTIYFHADVSVTEILRLPLTVGFATHSPAQWV